MSSPATPGLSPVRVTLLYVLNEYDPDRDGELLPARDVCALLHVARSTLPLWRDRGDLIGYKGRNGHWRYPSRQPTLAEARAALDDPRAASRAAAQRRRVLVKDARP